MASHNLTVFLSKDVQEKCRIQGVYVIQLGDYPGCVELYVQSLEAISALEVELIKARQHLSQGVQGVTSLGTVIETPLEDPTQVPMSDDAPF